MKKLIATVLFLSSALAGFAQFGVTVTYQYGISGKDMYSSEMKNSVAGINAKLSYTYDDYLKLNLGTGYYLIPYENIAVDGVKQPVSGVNLSVLPVTIGAEFFFIDQRPDVKQKVKPYLGLDLGWALTTQSESDYAPATTRNNFILVPSFGATYALGDNLDLNVCIRENLLIYSYRDKVQYKEIFSLLGINAGVSYRF